MSVAEANIAVLPYPVEVVDNGVIDQVPGAEIEISVPENAVAGAVYDGVRRRLAERERKPIQSGNSNTNGHANAFQSAV
ncbi:MAG TPA: hypothetical protein VLG16_02465 [Candidatus Saccharimonadales bacterium]|nr:hypothetical protein [Candidatus Saccharimonadales bacterium]